MNISDNEYQDPYDFCNDIKNNDASSKLNTEPDLIPDETRGEMPNCVENILISMLLKLRETCLSEGICLSLKNDFSSFTNCLSNEYNSFDLTAEIKQSVESLAVFTEHNNWKQAEKEILRLLKILRPFDLEDLFSLMEKTKMAEARIKDKEVVLLIGRTGSGKSTTLHCLAGSKFKKIESKDHYEPFEFPSDLLKQVKTSTSANSETRYILPIELDLKALINKKGSIFLCDTPGFNDTAGCEVDIANTYGIIEAIKACKNVRLVVFISSKSLGDRYEGIIEMAELLLQMIPKIEDHLKSVAYVYTKFASVDSITHALKEALDKDDLSEPISEIIESMLEESPILIDPLNPESAKTALKRIVKLSRIEYPNEIFKNITNSKAYDCLMEQVNLHERAIDTALAAQNFDIITFKLNQLCRLKSCLKIDSACDRLIGKLNVHFAELYKTCWAKINTWSKDNTNILNQAQVDEINESLQKFKNANYLISVHLDSKFGYAHDLKSSIVEQCTKIVESFRKCSCRSPDVQQIIHNLENIRIICSKFTNEHLDKLFDNTRELVLDKFESKVNLIRYLLQDKFFDFDQIGEILIECRRLKTIYRKNFESQDVLDLENKFKSACRILTEFFEAQETKILVSLTENEIEPLEFLIELIENLHKSLDCAQLCALIDKEDLKRVLSSINEFVLKKIASFILAIETLLSQGEADKLTMHSIEANYKEIQKWREIGDAASATSDTFHKLKNKIIDFLVELNKSMLEDSFDSFRNNHEKVNFEPMKSYFEMMKNAEWLDQLKENFYFDMYKKFEVDLLKKAKDLSINYAKLSITVENYKNIKDANQIYVKMARFEPLVNTNAEICLLVENVGKNFCQKMQSAFSVIKKELTEDNLKKEKLKCSFLDCSIKFIDEATSNSVTVINENELEVLKNSIKDFLNSYHNTVNEEFEENFKSIKNAEVNSEKIMSEKCEKMLARFKEFVTMKNSHSSIYQLVNSHEDLVDKWKGSLVDYSSELAETMNFSRLNQQDRELNAKILIAKVLSYFDTYFDSRSNRLFYDLFIKYQTESIEETISLRKTIIELLNRRDFSTVRIELSRLDDLKISEKNLSDIRNSINLAIESLVESVESSERKITKELNQDTVEDLIKYLKILRKVQREILDFPVDEQAEKSNYSKVIDREISKYLTSSLETIHGKLFAKLTAYLESMTKSIDSDDFYEVEERREKFDQVRTVLADHFADFDDIQKMFDSIETKLEKIVESLVDRYDKMPLEDYKHNYPRDFFEKLEKIKAKKQKYSEAYKKIEDQIIRNIRQYMNSLQDKSFEERLDFIEGLLWYLPENINRRLSSEIARKKKDFADHKSRLESELMRSLEVDDVEKIFTLKKTLTPDTQDLSDFLDRKLSENLHNKIYEMKRDLRNESVEQAVKKLEKVNKYVGQMSEEKISNELLSCGIEDEFLRKFENVKPVLNMAQKADLDEFERNARSVEEFFICFRVFTDGSFKAVFKDDAKRETVENEMKEFLVFFKNNRKEFDEGLDQTLMDQVVKTVHISLKCDQIVKIAKDTLLKSNYDLNLGECTSICLVKLLNEKSESLTRQILKTDFMHIDKVKYEKERITLYKDVHSKLKFIKELNRSAELKAIGEQYRKNLDKMGEHEAKVEAYLNKCVLEISGNILKIMESVKFEDLEMKSLRLNYENLVSIDCVFEESLSTSARLKDIQSRLLNKCRFISLEVNPSPACMETTVASLLNLKLVADNLSSLKSQVDALIEDSLKKFQKSKGGFEMLNLASALEDDDTGLLILRDYKIFKGEMIRNRAEKTAKHNIDYVLENLRGDAVAKDQLEKRYNDFEKEYNDLIKHNISSISNTKTMDKLVNETKKIINNNNKRKIFGSDVKNKIPSLVAHIFAVWTLKNTKYYNEMKEVSNKDAYLLKPHPAQVIAIFRLLGSGYDTGYLKMAVEIICDSDLQNNLVQVGTGEGKSVILAVASVVLALAGFEVYCACYSEYLSERDYNDFKDIFIALGVEKQVFYGTFNQVCENFLNQNHDIRDRVLNLIKTNAPKPTKSNSSKTIRPKILLIDEVDVFFNQDFLGNLYVPSARLKDPSITSLLGYVWNQRKSINFQSLKITREYKDCKDKFTKWIGLIDEALKDVLDDLKNYESHEYTVFEDRIAYKEQDGVQTNIVYGYKTLFAYYHEHERGKISTKSLNDNLSLGIYCGCFSYCEIPKKFQYILGVTGTLETLSLTQKAIIADMYKIKFATYIPSIYGERKLVFRNEADTLVSTKVDFHLRLKDEIDKRILGTVNADIKRCILIFFDKIETLNNFYVSPQMDVYRNNDEVNILKEDVTLNDKIYLIKKATSSGKITLLTRSFGRGIDFVCTSRSMLNNGGVHVIQTFLSDDPSEEIQIMGRTARQGETGSYSLILMDEDLEKYFGTSYKTKLETLRSNALVYNGLNEQRNAYFNKQTESILKAIEDVKGDHETSEEFLNKLFDDNLNFVKNFLIEKNRGAVLSSRRSKTICLMDATGSMGHLLDQVKNTICVMFDRAVSVLKEYSLPADSFEIQLVVYRDYDSRQKVLQVSGWEIKPLNLRNFMSTVSAHGGGDYEEAIEIGLWHVNQEQKKLEHPDKISQVILIGDAPAKSKSQIRQYRDAYGGEAFWKSTKFKTPTHYKIELDSIKACSIPVHTFYVRKGPEECFAEIASKTGGQTGFLDVNSSNGAERLIDLVTPLILSDVGTLNGGMGTRLVEEYKKKYPKSYK